MCIATGLYQLTLQATPWPTVVGTRAQDDVNGPVQSVKRFYASLAEGSPGKIFADLPKSYQNDLKHLIENSTKSIDRDIWNDGFKTLAKLAGVLRDKRELVLGSPFIKAIPNSKELGLAYDPVVSIVRTLATSELADHSQASQLDIKKFLDETGKQVMKPVLEISAVNPRTGNKISDDIKQLATVDVKVESTEGGRATVSLSLPNRAPRSESLVLVEGKWVLESLSEQWDVMMSNADSAIDRINPNELADRKPTIMKNLKTINAMLAELETIDDQATFSTKMLELLEKLGGIARPS